MFGTWIMLEEGLSYPFRGEDGIVRVVIGGVLNLLSMLIIPAILLLGYYVRVLRETALENEEPPKFDDWGTMLVGGIQAIIISIVYGIVPFAIAFGIMIFGGLLGGAAGRNGGAGIIAGFGLLGIFLFFLASLVLMYLLPAALTNFATEERFGAAFDFETIGAVVTSSKYFGAWLAPIVVYTIMFVVNLILAVTFFGLILSPWVTFYGSVAIFRMFGQAYLTAVPGDDAAAVTDGSTAEPM